MMDLQCDEFVEQVTDFLEDALDAEAKARFLDHLATCPGCEPYLDQFRRTIHALGELNPYGRAASGASRVSWQTTTWRASYRSGLHELSTGGLTRPRPARPAGLEPATDRLEVCCSIRLSYGRSYSPRV
jgi:anti-sigma factor RsiW